jgi:MFS family permease
VLIGVATGQETPILLFAVLPVAVVGFSAVNPSLLGMLSLRTDESEQGGILGLGQSMSAMARILGPIVGIFLFNQPNGETYPYWEGAALMVLVLLLVLSLRSAGSQSGEEQSTATDSSA